MHKHEAQLQQDDHKSDATVHGLVDDGFSGEGYPKQHLVWWPEGIGYYPIEDHLAPYNQHYFDRFESSANTDLGRALMRARVNFVEQHYRGALIDVGIGCGAFIELRQRYRRSTYGYDVNPAALEWLDERKILVDPYLVSFDGMSLWDVLEHIPDYPSLLENVREWLFLSLPIFCDPHHVLRSKHFRPDEHCWYFTRDGLVFAMKKCGFSLISESSMESDLGREDIGSFAFKRDA